MPNLQSHNDIQQGRPLALDHVIGQERARRQLKTALEAHYNDRARGQSDQAFPHVLLVGPSGTGKSTLAQIIANELGGTLHEELAQNIYGPPLLHGLLMLADDHDCIFVDEIHELPTEAQTTLYRALEERRLFLQTDSTAKEQSVTLPPFTFVAATTDEWRLTKPLRDRFKLVLRLTHYTPEELTHVVMQRARRVGWPITEASARAIAMRGRGTPRVTLRLLEAAWRTCRAEAAATITTELLKRAFDIEGVDEFGLDPVEQRYLTILVEAGGASRLNVIATRLGLPIQTVMMFEDDLIRLGLVGKELNGHRILTDAGRSHTRRS